MEQMNSPASSSYADFAFAFDDSNFSDRVLRIEIVPDSPNTNADTSGSNLSDWVLNRKRRRDNDIGRDTSVKVYMLQEEQILQCNMPDTEDAIGYENDDDEVAAMIEESPVGGDEALLSNVSSSNMDDVSDVVRVRTLHISSPILAARSPFFYKLFSNGMKESEQRQVTLKIHESEEDAFMDLLNFMYSNTISASNPSALLDVLMAADKYEVSSCMRYCSQLLLKSPMTCESALLYLDLHSSISLTEAMHPLTEVAKQFLALRYKDMSKLQEEVLKLPLAGIEAVLSSDDLQVASEDAVYDFSLKWARTHYPNLEERREVLSTHFIRLIRFPHMTCRKLKKVLSCNDFNHEISSKVVLEALFFKAEPPYRQRSLASEDASSSSRRFIERAYKYRPVKVVEFEKPHQQCIVYLDLKREECAHLFPSGRIYSQAFHLGGQGFFLSAHCNMDQQSSFHCLGLFLGMQEKGAVAFAVDYEFGVRTKPGDDFVSKYRGNYTFTGGKAVGYRNLFGIPWTALMAEDSIYFFDGVLHLKAELTIRK